MTTTVLHGYAVVEPPPARLPTAGVGGGEVGLHVIDTSAGRLTVVVGHLDAEQYGPEAWRKHAEDPRWLEPVARAHHDVLDFLCRRDDVRSVVPLRLPGIYPDAPALEGALAAEAGRVRRCLDAVRDHLEWGVKVYGTRPPLVPEQPKPSTGRDYLQGRASAQQGRELQRLRRQRALIEVHSALAEVATHGVLNPPQDRALSGSEDPMLLNGAYLVGHATLDEFFSVAERLDRQIQGEGLRLEVTGPWPPYNFADLGATGSEERAER